jgi:transposase
MDDINCQPPNITHEDREKIRLISAAAKKQIPQKSVAASLCVSERQVRRLVATYRHSGPHKLLQQNRGRSPHNKISEETRGKVAELYKECKPKFGPLMFSELLEESYGIRLSSESVRRILSSAGLWAPAKVRVVPRRRRKRKPCRGELVQMDSCEHSWFGENHPSAFLISMIDDATSRTYSRLYSEDSEAANMDCIRRYIGRYGIPAALYTDLSPHFTNMVTKRGRRSTSRRAGSRPQTQIQRALRECRTQLILSRAPQGKGRVERSFRTARIRLAGYLQLKGVTDVEAANEVVDGYFADWLNSTCTIPPASEVDLHRPAALCDAEAVFSLQATRVVCNDYTFSYRGLKYQIESSKGFSNLRRCRVTIEERLDGTLRARYKGVYLPVSQRPLSLS